MRAKRAQANGAFKDEIVGMKIAGRGSEVEVATDEQPRKADPAKIPTLKPAFAKDGTVTAANSSSISDGAAALVLTRAATIAHFSAASSPCARYPCRRRAMRGEPRWFSTAPVGAISKALKLAGWTQRTTSTCSRSTRLSPTSR